MHPTSLLLVGCGAMGSAMLSRWQQTHEDARPHITVIDPASPSHPESSRLRWLTSLSLLPAEAAFECIVFAIKPQQMETLLPAYRARFAEASPLYISIAAGKTLSYLHQHLGQHAAIIRAMPNTPAAIGKGMTTLVASTTTHHHHRQHAESLMRALGDIAWLDDEAQLDIATAIAGSGPAYCFLFMECLMDAAMQRGLSEPLARQLAVATLGGSAELAATSTTPLAELRQRVTSPGGTTEAALTAFMAEGGLKQLVNDAISRAIARSKQL